MRHGSSLRKFSRTSGHRRAMFRNLATSLVAQGKLETTVARAKDLRRVVEKLITLAKVDTLANRRLAYSYLLTKAAVQKLFKDLGPRYKGRAGGYTRVLRTSVRKGDAAPLALVSFVGEGGDKPTKKKARRSRSKTQEGAAESQEAVASGNDASRAEVIQSESTPG